MGSFFSSLFDPAAGATAPEEGDSNVVAIHSKESWNGHWAAHKDSNKLLVVDFSAKWCGPCRLIEPAFRALAARFTDVSFVKIDVDELSAVAQEWKVQAMPTFVLMKAGREVSRVVGADQAQLERKIQQLRP
ncbi:Thioredoxin H2-2 [Apostasia shenzhenica]|uniref:Thioredoxin H2-2 n=1 Tax=Apostasia shenzhenica TaxID=1088818 RepID=A0A2H9ZYM9_9ASPA|nr:Thioredoxin H2-2 [Apostasia shenzhenica]